ncbi:rhomboid-related protein 4-like [Ruditapes philippinarum]|uniref:rhomboid-related protein 4-like n=1 Tax=Ruditapes philippinarum TaxID=129788 RepID=UPI00295B9596|nr:rhomboid-related protein 4-like [Ruditapes philippinarum]XP_060580705.1 rhomboid-related protein 4-like [Ruditapes philippinarum]
MFRPRQRRGGNLGVMLLALQLFQFGFDKIPPVTLISILVQAAIFLRIGDLDRWFGSTHDVCISTHYILVQKQWGRLILGTLVHASDMHLYFNMVSLLWKGVFLERRFKSQYFAYLMAVFTVLTSVVLVGLNWVMAEVCQDRSYMLTCAVGFSGVIFALKVLTTHYSPPGLHYALGFIPVPSKYIYWVELGIIQLIYPNASFTGHLAGILVGMLYIKGPLKFIMDSFWPPEPSYRYTAGNTGYQRPITRGYTTGGRQAEYRANYNDNRQNDDGNQAYDEYTGGLSEEEQIRRATEESRHNNRDPNNGQQRLYPDLDELRRRRADRYT